MKAQEQEPEGSDLLTKEERGKETLFVSPPAWREVLPQGIWGWTKAIVGTLIFGVMVYILMVLMLAM